MPTVLPLEPTVAAQRTPARAAAPTAAASGGDAPIVNTIDTFPDAREAAAWAAALTARLDQRASPTPAPRAARDAARAAHAPALVAAQHRLALLAALAAPPRRLP